MEKLTVYVFFFWSESSGGHEWHPDKDIILGLLREYRDNPHLQDCMFGFREYTTDYPADTEQTVEFREELTNVIDELCAEWEQEEEAKVLASAQ